MNLSSLMNLRQSIPTIVIFITILCLTIIAGERSHAQTPQTEAQTVVKTSEKGELRLGAPVEQELKGGDEHSYRVRVETGQFLKVIVEQKGIDVAVQLFGSDGKPILQVDTSNGTQGPELVSLIAPVAGVYRLDVKSLDIKATPGRYEVRFEELREATPKDKDRIAAERALAEAAQFHVQGTAESLRKTLEKYEEALLLWQRLGDQQREALTLNMIGDRYRDLGESQKALGYHNQAVSLRRALGDRQGEGVSLYNIGFDYFQLGDSQKALEYFNQALPLLRAVKDREAEANTLGVMGLAYQNLGRLAESLDHLNQALQLHRLLGNRMNEANALSDVSMPYFYLGQWQKALECLNQALSLVRQFNDRRIEGDIVNNIGFIYRQVGETHKALEYYTKALELRRAAGDRNKEANSLYNIGGIYWSLDDVQKALDYYNQTLSIVRTVGDRRGEAYTLLGLAVAHRSQGETHKALDFFNQALLLWRTLGDPMTEALTLDRIGTTYSLLKKHDEAARYLEQALTLQRQIGARSDEVETLAHLARVEQGRGRLTVARSQIEAVLDIVEGRRSQFVGQQMRTSFLAFNHEFYELYIDVLMQMHQNEPLGGHDAVAFAASERARARGLLEILAEARVDLRQGVDAALLERESSVQQQLSTKSDGLTRLLNSKHTEDQATAARKEIDALLTDYQDVTAQIRAKSPRYAELTQPKPLSTKEIQQLLDKDTLLLEYALGEERSYLWALTATSVNSFELPKRSEIEAVAQQLYKLITTRKNRDLDAQKETATVLSRMLLKPVATQLGRKRLLIVSDAALHYIPFAALPDPVEPNSRQLAGRPSKSKYQPLVVNHEIVTLPSASVLAIGRQTRADRKSAAKTVAIFADPVFAADDPRIKPAAGTERVAASPQVRADNKEDVRSDVERSARELGLDAFQRLRFTRDEAEAIARQVPSKDFLLALDFDASRPKALSEQLGQYRIIHFATHGLVNNEHPELSGIVLSLVDSSGQPQNGFVRLHDVYNLKLPTELVVLSGCRSALGKEVKGEGLIGLTRGFMYAGAERVMVSLWSVSDEGTAELMKKFYQGMLGRGLRPAAALREAQVAMWKRDWWEAPYYWSGFVIQGDW